jgi:hypothetical protein
MRRYDTASTYVAPIAPESVGDPVADKMLTQNWDRDVVVPFFANLLGGVGVFILAFVLYEWITGWEIEIILWIAGRWSAGLFSAMCIIRFLGDEVQEWMRRAAKGWAEGSVNQKLKWYKNECDRLQMENRQQASQLAQMTRNVRSGIERADTPVAPRVAQDEYTEPLRDALALCRFQESHGKISRDLVVASGTMDRARWEAAKGLLINAAAPVENGVIGTLPTMAMAKVREFVEKQRKQLADFVAPYEQ